jgi:hypothetical protein
LIMIWHSEKFFNFSPHSVQFTVHMCGFYLWPTLVVFPFKHTYNNVSFWDMQDKSTDAMNLLKCISSDSVDVT